MNIDNLNLAQLEELQIEVDDKLKSLKATQIKIPKQLKEKVDKLLGRYHTTTVTIPWFNYFFDPVFNLDTKKAFPEARASIMEVTFEDVMNNDDVIQKQKEYNQAFEELEPEIETVAEKCDCTTQQVWKKLAYYLRGC